MLYKNINLWNSNKKDYSFLAFGCLHAPFHDKNSVDWLIERIARDKPDVIFNLGDFLEANAASRFVKSDNEKYSIIREFEAADKVSKRIIEASPDSIRIWIQGNHEANLLDKSRIDKRFREIADYTKSPYLTTFNEWLHPVKYVSDKKGTVRIGQVTVGHGTQTLKFADQAQAIRFAEPNGLFIGSHTHKPRQVTQCETVYGKLPYFYANTGTMGNLHRKYSSRLNTDEWGTAIVTGESTTTYSALEKPHWKAKTEIYKMKSSKINIDVLNR